MREFDIVLNSLQQVQRFVSLAMIQPFEIMVGNDYQHINGKDLMGMFSLDYSIPVRVQAICSEAQFDTFRSSALQLCA